MKRELIPERLLSWVEDAERGFKEAEAAYAEHKDWDRYQMHLKPYRDDYNSVVYVYEQNCLRKLKADMSVGKSYSDLFQQARDLELSSVAVEELTKFAQSVEKRRVEGENKRNIEFAKIMKANKEPIEKIISYTGLSISEIKQL